MGQRLCRAFIESFFVCSVLELGVLGIMVLRFEVENLGFRALRFGVTAFLVGVGSSGV